MGRIYAKIARPLLFRCGAEWVHDRAIAASALVQLMTGLIDEGPGLLRRIHRGLCRLLERDGFRNIAEAVGTSEGRSSCHVHSVPGSAGERAALPGLPAGRYDAEPAARSSSAKIVFSRPFHRAIWCTSGSTDLKRSPCSGSTFAAIFEVVGCP